MIQFDDADRRMLEQVIDAPTAIVDLSPLMYLAGVQTNTIEVYVNGLLRVPSDDYFGYPDYVEITEMLEEGDTVRVTAVGVPEPSA